MLIDPFDVQPGDRITIVGMRGEPDMPATVIRLGDVSHPLPYAWVQCDARAQDCIDNPGALGEGQAPRVDHETFVALWRKDLVLPLGSGMVEVTRRHLEEVAA